MRQQSRVLDNERKPKTGNPRGQPGNNKDGKRLAIKIKV